MAEHFVIAGAQRSATSWLYDMLDHHPRITMARPLRPEPKYFLRDGPDDAAAYRGEFFAGARGGVLGEKSTSYIEHPSAAMRIARCLPGARVVFMLRDPVERAISNWRFSVANGLEPLPLDEALEAEPRRIAAGDAPGVSVSPFAYVARGRYAEFLAPWRAAFPGDRMKLLVTEATVGDADAMRGLCMWLGVDGDVPLGDLSVPVNASPAGGDVPPAVRDRLRDAFAASNETLAAEYGLDIGRWQ